MRRVQRLFLATLLALVAIAPAEPAPAAPRLRWQVDRSPFLISFYSGSTLLTQESVPPDHGPGPAHRLSYQTSDGATHSLTDLRSEEPVPGGVAYTVATDEPDRTARVVVRRSRDGIEVRWTLEPSTGVTTIWEAFVAFPGEHYLGGGESERFVDLAHQVVPFKVWGPCRTYAPVPYYASSRGYAVAVLSGSVGRAEFAGSDASTTCDLGAEQQCPLANAPREVQLCFKDDSLTYFVYAGSPAQTLDAYTRATGRAMLPPTSEFGLVKWRDAVAGPAELLDDVTTLRRLGIPIEWVLLDNPWEKSLCYGTLEFGPPKFPNGAGEMIRAIHRAGVKLMLWVSPYVRRLPGCPFPVYPLQGLIGTDDSQALDLTQPAIYAEFVSRLKALAQDGVDGVKGDRADEVDFERDPLAGGPGAIVQNLYPYLFDKAIHEAFGSGARDTWTGMVRAASPQSRSIVPGIWAGDQEGTFDGLRRAIRAAASAGASGFPIWGSDVGGFASSMLTPEVFVRWAQLGAISPLLEVGGAGPNATFWQFGQATVKQFRDAAVLHYELFPYLYELAREATRNGSPVLRPLAFQYPTDAEAWKADLELLVGSSLLALPTTVPVDEASSQYFPEGRWVPLWGGPAIAGPRLVHAYVPLETLPLYLRAGTAIPFDFRQPLVWLEPWGVDDLDRPGRIGWVYAPGSGRTEARSTDERFSAVSTGRRIDITLAGRRCEIEILVLTSRAPRAVSVDGRAVGRTASAAGLRRRPSGWTLVRSRFHGVVVKVSATSLRTHVTLGFSPARRTSSRPDAVRRTSSYEAAAPRRSARIVASAR